MSGTFSSSKAKNAGDAEHRRVFLTQHEGKGQAKRVGYLLPTPLTGNIISYSTVGKIVKNMREQANFS